MEKVSAVFLLGLVTCLLLHPELGWTMLEQREEESAAPRKARERRAFTSAEDAQIVSLVQELGENDWGRVAAGMGGNRNPRQCRERWRYYLKSGLCRSPLTWDELALLFQKVAELGPRWSRIARFFPGRSEIICKNAYRHACRGMRRAHRGMNPMAYPRASQSVSPRVGGTPDLGLPGGHVDGTGPGFWDPSFDWFGEHVDGTGFELGGLSLANPSPADRLEGFGEHPFLPSNRDSFFPGSP
ncbi:MAG: hypothetical protein LBJ70_02860 [Holosporales bacterium]|jgi:hypothetical protein|nr:hypothetical protein [Holosporales bacterium]